MWIRSYHKAILKLALFTCNYSITRLVLTLCLAFTVSSIKVQHKLWYACDSIQVYNGKLYGGRKFVEKFYRKRLEDTTKYKDSVLKVKNEDEAIKIAEPVVFKEFGIKATKSERPYEIYLINGKWIIRGVLKSGYVGYTFHVIVNARTGKMEDFWEEK